MEGIRAKIKKMENTSHFSLNKYELDRAIRQEKRRKIKEKYDDNHGWKEQILDDFEPNFEQFSYESSSSGAIKNYIDETCVTEEDSNSNSRFREEKNNIVCSNIKER